MWKVFKILITVSFLFLLNIIQSQPTSYPYSGFPLKHTDSPLFGKDIIINYNPNQDQRNVALCSAFNGWLYAAYSYVVHNPPFDDDPYFVFLRSVDNGITWEILWDYVYPVNNGRCTCINLTALGDSISNIKVFLSAVVANTPEGHGIGFVDRFNGNTGAGELALFESDGIFSIALTSDFNYPAINANPNSMGFIYSRTSYIKDTVAFFSSSDGGQTFSNHKILSVSSKALLNVDVAYGRSLSENMGRYFAVWEEKNSYNSSIGHIYTAHTEPNFNSSFSSPNMLDSIDSTNINMCRNPVIACQYNDIDNDSLNITEIVLFENYLPESNNYDIIGLYNMKPTNTNYFKKFILDSSPNNKQQPSIKFNPFDSTFMVTYYDSTTQKLPFLLNNFSMSNPDAWQVVNSGYNDNSNLSAPYPRVALNLGQQQGVNFWTGEGTGGKGVALFDAPYSTYTGISNVINTDDASIVKTYPNPCNQKMYFSFELNKSAFVSIAVQSMLGRPIGTITNRLYPEGKNTIQYDVSYLPTGFYFYKFDSNNGIKTTGTFIILR